MTLQEIVQHPYFALVMAFLAILSLILTVIFYRRSRRHKKPLFATVQRTIIENSTPMVPGFSVHFNGEKQPRVTVVQLWFWNQGDETIRAVDIPKASPLEIAVAPGASLLNAQIVKTTDDANQCSLGEPQLKEDGSMSIPLRFDYLDHEDGMVVQIVHNGDSCHLIRICGNIMGVKEIRRAVDASTSRDLNIALMIKLLKRPKLMGLVSIFLFAGIGVALCVQAITEKHWILFVPAAIALLLALACYPMYFRAVIPKKLNISLGDPRCHSK